MPADAPPPRRNSRRDFFICILLRFDNLFLDFALRFVNTGFANEERRRTAPA